MSTFGINQDDAISTSCTIDGCRIVEHGNFLDIVHIDCSQRIIEETTDAQIKFLVNQSDIRGSEKKTEAIVALTKAIKEAKAAENKEFKSIEISSYASPEGELNWNEKLSNRRGEASSKYINRELKKLKALLAKIRLKFYILRFMLIIALNAVTKRFIIPSAFLTRLSQKE